MELENTILSEVTQSQKNTHSVFTLTDKWILAQKLGIPNIQFTDQAKLKQRMALLVLKGRRGPWS